MLEKHHITDLYVVVDDLLVPKIHTVGRPTVLSTAEIITVLIWHSFVQRDKTLKEIHENLRLYHADDFPNIPSYSTFVQACHRALPELICVLQSLLVTHAPIRILDSTMLPVCKLQRADEHKVAKNIAQFGKNWQGWHYGFKLHASIDLQGRLCGIYFTPANTSDIHGMPRILNEHCRLAVGDTLYGARVMGNVVKKMYGTIIIAPPHPKQKKKIMTPWQQELLSLRSKIESTFDILKEHMHLVTSFPRSVTGFFLHYLRVLIGYQLSHF